MNAKLLAKSKVLEELLSEMDESILSKIKKGDVDADVKVIKMEAMPSKDKESVLSELREEEPEGEDMEGDEDYSSLDAIKSRYASKESMPMDDEEEEDPEFAELKEFKKKYKG